MTDILLAAYVVMPTIIIAGCVVAIFMLRRSGTHHLHPGE